MATTAIHRLTLDPMGKYSNIIIIIIIIIIIQYLYSALYNNYSKRFTL